jgi:hypothetical protein
MFCAGFASCWLTTSTVALISVATVPHEVETNVAFVALVAFMACARRTFCCDPTSACADIDLA